MDSKARQSVPGNYVRQFRNLANFTQDGLGRIVDRTWNWVSRLERSVTAATPDEQQRVADALNIPVSVLFPAVFEDPGKIPVSAGFVTTASIVSNLILARACRTLRLAQNDTLVIRWSHKLIVFDEPRHKDDLPYVWLTPASAEGQTLSALIDRHAARQISFEDGARQPDEAQRINYASREMAATMTRLLREMLAETSQHVPPARERKRAAAHG